MWKAIIKLVEKWAYRCEHEWKKEHSVDVYEGHNTKNELPIRTERTYICKKCMKHKKIS